MYNNLAMEQDVLIVILQTYVQGLLGLNLGQGTGYLE
jgi:hypothetical protein